MTHRPHRPRAPSGIVQLHPFQRFHLLQSAIPVFQDHPRALLHPVYDSGGIGQRLGLVGILFLDVPGGVQFLHLLKHWIYPRREHVRYPRGGPDADHRRDPRRFRLLSHLQHRQRRLRIVTDVEIVHSRRDGARKDGNGKTEEGPHAVGHNIMAPHQFGQGRGVFHADGTGRRLAPTGGRHPLRRLRIEIGNGHPADFFKTRQRLRRQRPHAACPQTQDVHNPPP